MHRLWALNLSLSTENSVGRVVMVWKREIYMSVGSGVE